MRAKDRAAGIWRPTMKCEKMSEQAYNALSREEKNKGSRIFGRPRAGQASVGANANGSANAQGAPGNASAPGGGVSASSATVEDAFASYAAALNR